MGTMRMVVEKHLPFINRINPAALISDCFYTLNNYDNLQRFATNLLTLSVMAVLFLAFPVWSQGGKLMQVCKAFAHVAKNIYPIPLFTLSFLWSCLSR